MGTGLAKRSLASTAYDRIKREILSCRLEPGTSVVANKLAADYGMSRMPIHEALKALCAEGYMRVVPRVGYLVTTVSMSDVREIFQLRLVLEPAGARLAAERYTPSDTEKFKEWQRRGMEALQALPDPDLSGTETLFALNREFHVLVATLSGNVRLADLVGSLIDQSQRVYFLQFSPGDTPGDPHGDVFRAIERRDSEAAHKAMEAHIRDGQEATVRALAGMPSA